MIEALWLAVGVLIGWTLGAMVQRAMTQRREEQRMFIIKVQAPIAEDLSRYLITNKDRSIECGWPIGANVGMDRLMADRAKRYFWAELDGNGLLDVQPTVEVPEWECDW